MALVDLADAGDPQYRKDERGRETYDRRDLLSEADYEETDGKCEHGNRKAPEFRLEREIVVCLVFQEVRQVAEIVAEKLGIPDYKAGNSQ